MIREQELLDAIAECQGDKNPNANTCIKLAAYYVILEHLYPQGYSYSEPPYDSGSEFAEVIRGKSPAEVYKVLDELMEAVQIMIPKMYRATIEKLRD